MKARVEKEIERSLKVRGGGAFRAMQAALELTEEAPDESTRTQQKITMGEKNEKPNETCSKNAAG